MKVSSVLKSKGSDVHTIRPEEPIQTVLRAFKEKNIGSLVVFDNYFRGMITERDIILGLAEYGGDLLAKTVAEVMQKGAVCSPDDDLELVMSRMTTRRVRHIAVSDEGVLCGIISIGDVVKKQLSDFELETNVLRDAYRASAAAA